MDHISNTGHPGVKGRYSQCIQLKRLHFTSPLTVLTGIAATIYHTLNNYILHSIYVNETEPCDIGPIQSQVETLRKQEGFLDSPPQSYRSEIQSPKPRIYQRETTQLQRLNLCVGCTPALGRESRTKNSQAFLPYN